MAMKLNLSYPPHGSVKLIELDDEKKSRLFIDRRISEEVPADALGDDWKGYIIKITGGNDKQGFAMKQGVLINHRTTLLLDGTSSGFHPWKRPGHRKRKSVRGCIIGTDIAVVNAIIVKKGDQDLPGLTDPDSVKPSLRGPKRANHIRKLWGLSKEEDVRQFVSRKKLKKDRKDGKPRYQSPKIQRLITPRAIQRKKRLHRIKKERREKAKEQATEYAHLLSSIRREKRKALIEKKRAQSERRSQRLSEKAGGETKAAKPTEEKTKKTKKEEPAGAEKAAKKAKKEVKGKQTSKTDVKKEGGKPSDKPAAKKDQGSGKPADKSAKGAAKPAAKSDKPADKSASKGAAKPADKPAAKPSDKPAAKPADKPAAKPADKPAAKSADKPAGDKPAAKPAAR